MKNKNNIFELFTVLFCLFLILLICIKYFVFHEVLFKDFIIGLIFFGTSLIASYYGYFYGNSSMKDILNQKESTKGDNAHKVWGLIIGLVGIYLGLFDESDKLKKNILLYGGIFFVLLVIIDIFLTKRKKNKRNEHI